MEIGRTVFFDGIVTSQGGNATIPSSGGGSGGSILLKAFNFSGHGRLDASGGNGHTKAAGGSGGRIAVHIGFKNTFSGQYLCHGGRGGHLTDPKLSDGGPGTVYKYESNRGPQYRELKYDPRLNATVIKPEHSKLLIENSDLKTDNFALVMENDTIYYEFDEVQVEGHSYVHFYHPKNAKNVTILIHELTGNRKGFVRIQNRQQAIIQFVPTTHTYLNSPAGLHVDEGGEVVFPDTLVVLTKFIIEGRMIGVQNLEVIDGGILEMRRKAHTYPTASVDLWYTEDSVRAGSPGLIDIPRITISNAGKILLHLELLHNITVVSGMMRVQSGGILTSETLYTNLNATAVVVEKYGSIDGSGGGYGANKGPGAGQMNKASGGSHASLGKYIYGTYCIEIYIII